jgi:hypothetical protein
MTRVLRERPSTDGALRQALYDGSVLLLPPTAASLALVELTTALLRESLGDDPRRAHERFSDEDLFRRIGALRRELYFSAAAHDHVVSIGNDTGFPFGEAALDPARLRTIVHGACDNPRAAPAYFPHRDTWYGHPSCVVTIWVPLDDLLEQETFVFYPERFRAAVPNDSEAFDYDAWVAGGDSLKIGWQDRNASLTAHYPGVTTRESYGAPFGFSCKRGEILLFAGAQLHQTLPQRAGKTRFSLDARLVHLADERSGRGAPNVDGRARGSALRDYLTRGTSKDG